MLHVIYLCSFVEWKSLKKNKLNNDNLNKENTMKRNQFLLICTSVLTLTTLSLSTAAIAQIASESTHCPQSTEQDSTFGLGNPEWQAEFKGINLSSEQVNRVCELKAALERGVW